jgi:transcriptional regulator with XRE-family HTH domain
MTTSPDIADPQTIARRLRLVRELRRLSQGDVGHRAGVDQSYVSRLEQGDVPSPGLLQVSAVARALGIDLVALIAWDGDAFAAEIERIGAEPVEVPTSPESLESLAGPTGLKLGSLVAAKRSVLIAGRHGTGKTRLAFAAARRMIADIPIFITTDHPSMISSLAPSDADKLNVFQTDGPGLESAIRRVAPQCDGLVIDADSSVPLGALIKAAEEVRQLIVVCTPPKRLSERPEDDREIFDGVARRMRIDGSDLAETFDLMLATRPDGAGGFSTSLVELGLEPTLTKIS